MARIRTIKPQFFRDEELQDLESAHPGHYPMLVFAGLWGHCDKAGRFEWKPRQLKLDILPFLSFDMAETLGLLASAGFMKRYTVDGKQYGEIDGIPIHQRFSGKEAQEPEKHPPPPGTQPESISEASVKQSVSQEGNGVKEEEGSSELSPAGAALPCPLEQIVEAYHRLMPDNPRCKVLNSARRGAIKARWHEAAKLTCKPFGYSSAEAGIAAWETFFEVCAQSPFLTGRATPQPGKPPFVSDIDFLMSPKGFAGCIENKYHRDVA